MAERTGPDRSVEVEMSDRVHAILMTRKGRALLVAALVVIILTVATGGHIYGRILAYRALLARDNTIQQLRSEGQRLKAEINDQSAKLATLQAKLIGVQAKLDELMPSENTYGVSPNQSLIVADGHLTVGLIGAPANQSVNININGKQRPAAAGDVIDVAPDPSTSCQVRLQSFDMFKAIITATCTAMKPQ